MHLMSFLGGFGQPAVNRFSDRLQRNYHEERTGETARSDYTKPPRGGFVIRERISDLEYRGSFPPLDILDDVTFLKA
jgi:hypothetical protein